jgi:rhamnose transport system ATP-binding protein
MKQPTVAGAPWLELTGARKSFGTVAALVNGQLSLWPGEVHALLGENGAGKSTLVKILAGVHAHDAGELRVGGRVQRFRGPSDARDAGIAVIYQEPTLFPDLTVMPRTSSWAASRCAAGAGSTMRGMRADAALRLLRAIGVDLDPLRPAVRGLSIADQQVVEIAKALSLEARSDHGRADRGAVRRAKSPPVLGGAHACATRAVAILFISHRLDEVFALCDTGHGAARRRAGATAP